MALLSDDTRIKWRIAFRNLGRNRRRNLATATAIAFGFAGLVLLGGYIIRVERYLRVNSIYINHAGHVAIYKRNGLDRHLSKPAAFNLTQDEQAGIERALSKEGDRIEFVGRYLKTVGLAGNGCKSVPFFGTGIEPEIEKRIRAHPEVVTHAPELAVYKKGRGFWEYSGNPEVVSVTQGLARLLGKPRVVDEAGHASGDSASGLEVLDCTQDMSEKIRADAGIQLAGRTFFGDLSALNGEIVSHYSTGFALTEDSGLVAPLEHLQKLYDTDAVTYFALYLKDDSGLAGFVSRLNERLQAEGVAAEAIAFRDERVSLFYVGTLSFLLVMAAYFVFLVFGVVALSIVNSMTMSIIERTREIGMLRSMGFTPEYVTGLFVREAVFLSAFSIAGGSVIALVVSAIVNVANIRFEPPGIAGDMQFTLTPNSWLLIGLALPIAGLTLLTARQTTIRRAREKIAKLLTSTAS